jgi:hypothetical protein
MIDDLSALHQISDDIAKKELHVFQPKPNYRMAQGGWENIDNRLEGQNHPNGVQFHFFVKDAYRDSSIVLEITEKDGTMIQSFKSKSTKKNEKLTIDKIGNSHIWNMRHDGFKEFPGLVLYSSPNLGPKAVPGEYVATLRVADHISSQNFQINKDPRLNITQEDFVKQRDFLLSVRDKVSEAHQAIIDIRNVKDDLDYVKNKIKNNSDQENLAKEIDELKSKLEKVENNIHQTKNRSSQDALNYGIRINNRLAFLLTDQQRGDFPPTDQAIEFKQDITAELDGQLRDLEKIITVDVSLIAKKISDQGISILQLAPKSTKP